MKIKNLMSILMIMCLALLCISCVNAAEADDNLTIEDTSTPLELDDTVEIIKENTTSGETAASNTTSDESNTKPVDNNTSDNQSTNTTKNQTNTTTTTKTAKIKPYILCDHDFPVKKSNTFKVKLYTLDKKDNVKYYKNVKLTVKVKIGKTTKTYNVKTNSKGEAKIMNVKNLKVGTYTVTVKTTDEKYSINEKGAIVIYGKAKKTITVKLKKTKYGIEATKKMSKGDVFYSFYEPKDAQNGKGVYARIYDAKDPLGAYPNGMIIKAKFFFKNNKNGKTISKTAKLTYDGFYDWDMIKVKPVKGYTPVKVTATYLTLR